MVERLRYHVELGQWGERLLIDQHGRRHAVPVSRAAARAKQSPFYMGKPHVACGWRLKYTSNKTCVQCNGALGDDYQARDPAGRKRNSRQAHKARMQSPMARLIIRLLYSTFY